MYGGSEDIDHLHLLALEINAVVHCNLSCIGCAHASPISPRSVASPETVRRDLANLATVVSADAVRVLGGEPLLHPDFDGLLRAIRDSGVSPTIRVVTNGTLLHRSTWTWLDLVDQVHVSHYPHTAVRLTALAELERRCRDGGKELLVQRYHSFRLMHSPVPLSADDAQQVFDTCQDAHAWSCHTVSEGYVYLCPTSVPISDGLAEADVERCQIEPLDGLLDRLRTFLDRRTPIRACSRCLGTVGIRIAHRQAPRKSWLPLSQVGSIDRGHLGLVQQNPWAENDCSTQQLFVPGKRNLA